jgi:glucose-6-phosphate 1-dehydrogenase
MITTHLFQVLGFAAMEPPTSLDARHQREETAKVFDAVKPIDVRHVVRGQYAGYQDEPGVAPGSQTETMAAVRVEVDNWRWAGVPFLLRSGKRLAASRQLVTLGFHEPPLRMFPIHAAGTRNGRDTGSRGYRKPVASGARWVGLEAGAVAEVAEGAAESVGEWLGGLVPG